MKNDIERWQAAKSAALAEADKCRKAGLKVAVRSTVQGIEVEIVRPGWHGPSTSYRIFPF